MNAIHNVLGKKQKNFVLLAWEEQQKKDLASLNGAGIGQFTRKELDACSAGSGPKGHRVITKPMAEFIMKVVVSCRGYPHEKHILNTERNRKLLHNGQYLDLSYPDIVDQLYGKFKELDKLPEKLVYSRVWWWCRANKITYRTPNKLSKKNEELIDQRCLGTLREVEKFVDENGLTLENCATVDETGLRPLEILLRTLHYKGAKDVPIENELTSHIMLTLFVIWFGNGEIDFAAVLKSPSAKTFWEKFSDVWFLKAFGSKMTSKETYPELLEVVLQDRKDIRLLPDDDHGGHKGTNPDNQLAQHSPPIKRIRIQGGCTADLAAADQVQANKVLKMIWRREMRKDHFKAALKGEKIWFEGTLTKKGCEKLGQVLTRVKKEWNSSPKLKEGVKKAFLQTLYPSEKKSKRLQKRLDNCKEKNLPPVYNPYSADPNAKEHCKDCGHSFATDKQKLAHEKDPNNCWGRRNSLKPPHFGKQNPNNPPRGMLLSVNNHLAVVVDHDCVYLLEGAVRLGNYFWKQGLPMKYFQREGLYKALYNEKEALITEALRAYDSRNELQRPLKADLFIMDGKVHFLQGDCAWELPQTRGRSKPRKLPPKFWQRKSLKFLDRDSNKGIYRFFNCVKLGFCN